ncbi:alpha-ketoglutarate-dependent dioxygenase AlkB family protein [Gelidibacter gilvus]|uniref:Alpha-ketoglutarate-dependent dioxygenase AlkB n=1 Tax=Gelidibacter gilvus TaxID=59602 RepID=A0A4V1LMT3_9FLAO|nr:alpha-ketoglutarate-dependent dioxygenase AlkB [Gelidibacter gilvus]RXJ49596.1 alpha-ketoglutarate-dependent dioxygenase AlkB [Gelidibacter gilvus]
MDLFDPSPIANMLPIDGEVRYYGSILDPKSADHYFDHLLTNSRWENDQVLIFGKLIVTKRKVAWYGDEPFQYTYSKTTKLALPWTKELLELKEIVENKSGETFNSCLLNLYHTGEEGMSWHSDDEKDLKKNAAIGSLSLGAARKFSFRHKVTNHTISLVLENGSLLIMKDQTQAHWKHRLPPTKKVSTPRINLTFRTIVS